MYCGYSTPPSSSAENVSRSAEPSASAPGSSRAIASTTTIAGSSPPERTYGPIEIASEQRWVTIRSSKPSKRAERSVRCSSPASSSTTCLVELAPLRRQRDHAVLGHAAVHGVERGRDDVDPQHHPGPPPYGASSTWPFASGVVSR